MGDRLPQWARDAVTPGVDLVVWAADRDRILDLLVPRGYAEVRLARPEAQFDVRKNREKVSFVLVQRQERLLVTPGYEHWPWPPGALDGSILTMAGISCRVIAPSALLAEKEEHARRTKSKPREKDHRDIELLRRLVASVLSH
jgi:hypothetical protein